MMCDDHKKKQKHKLVLIVNFTIKVRLLFFVAACNWDGGQTFASNVVHLDPSVFFSNRHSNAQDIERNSDGEEPP